MNRTQINNFLQCLSHIDDHNYMRLRTSSLSTEESTDDTDHDHDDSHQLLFAKIVAMVVLFCATAMCGSIPFLLNRYFKWTKHNTNARSATVVKCLLYFGGGLLLCTTFLHLLPEVQETIEQLQECGTLPELNFALAEMLMCGGFFLMYLVEELIHAYIHRNKKHSGQNVASAAFERGRSVRNSYLVKGKQPASQDGALEKPSSESVEGSIAMDDGNATTNDINVGISAQDLISHELDQQKYRQTLDINNKYSDNREALDHHHHHYHTHHHHDHVHSYHNHGHSHLPVGDASEDLIKSSLRGLLIVLALTLHELFEGIAIGLEGSASSVWFMFGAVSAHKLVLAFCVGVELIVARTRPLLSLVYVFTFAIVSPIGIGIGILISHNEDMSATGIPSAILQGLACGTLLYVVFFEILSKNRAGLVAYLALFVGFVVMFGLQLLGGLDEHGHSHGGCGVEITSARSGGSTEQHQHDEHADHYHNPPTTTQFEQQLKVLREASRELMSSMRNQSETL